MSELDITVNEILFFLCIISSLVIIKYGFDKMIPDKPVHILEEE
jgi:hypothetical protein